jgi:trans-aconitate 2-methyltransferase
MQTTDTWNPNQYHLFQSERQQPFFDLLKLIDPSKKIKNAVDLGCGTGELTQILHRKLQITHTQGIDRSASMLEKAYSLCDYGLEFSQDHIENWRCENGVDLIFANAALQWVPDHLSLIPRLLENLNLGGQIAIQIPANHDHISHLLASEIAQESPFKEALNGYVRLCPVLPVETYATLLHEHGLQNIQCFIKVYGHPLASAGQVVEWVRGTLLTDYQSRMNTSLYERFIKLYSIKLIESLGGDKPYFYGFKRILFYGIKPDR